MPQNLTRTVQGEARLSASHGMDGYLIDTQLADQIAACFKGIPGSHYPEGTNIYTPDDPGERLFLLRRGRVELFRVTAKGKRLVTRDIREGSIFGVMGILGQGMQGNFAEVVRSSSIAMISKQQMLNYLKARPSVLAEVLEVIGARLKQAEERLVEIAFSPVRVRLARFLLAQADGSTGVVVDITHEEIGDAIGALRQTVSETLGELRRAGLISTAVRRIEILDRAGMARMARGES